MADEVVVVDFVVNVGKAIADTASFRTAIEEAKTAIRAAMFETKDSIEVVSAAYAQQRRDAIESAKERVRIAQIDVARAKANAGLILDNVKTEIQALIDLNKAHENYRLVMKQSADSARAFAIAKSELNKEAKNSIGIFQKLGTVGKFVFGTVLGITAIGAFNALRTAITSLIAEGEKFLQILFKFQTSVRNLQRRGIDITFKEAAAQVKSLREEFGVFSEREAIAAVSNIQLLTANFKFTTKEMYKMTEAAAALAIITGEDLDEASRKLALFLSSGYSEGLQRAGLAINKLTVSQKAYQLGMIDTKFAYAQLTEVERAHVAEMVIEEQTATLLIEAQEALKTNYGRLKKAEADVETETAKLALALVPLKKAWLDFQLKFLEGFQVLRQILFLIGDYTDKHFVVPLVAGIYTIIKAFDDLKKGITHSAKEIIDIYNDLFDKIYKGGTEQRLKTFGLEYNPLEGTDLSEAEKAAAKQAQIEKEKAEAMEEAYNQRIEIMNEFYDVMQDYKEKELEIEQEYIDKVGYVTEDGLSTILGKFSDFYNSKTNMSEEDFQAFIAQQESLYGELGTVTEDGLDKLWELWKEYTEKIEEINRKLAEDIADENREYQQDLQDLERDTQQKLEDAARKYRYDQLRAEREFQEKMRRLREEFLFDLEDALRERDALAVLRLIRRYRLDVEQAQRQYELERQERAEAYRQEIEDIKRQAERKREELAIEHARKLEDLQREAQEERQQAEEDRQRAYDELMADLKKEREDAATERDLAKKELEDWLTDQISLLLLKYGEMENVTADMVSLMAQMFSAYLGKDGIIDATVTDFQGIIDRAVALAKQRLEELKQIALQVAELTEQLNLAEITQPENTSGRSAGGYASYGKYTLGEKGREFVLTAQTTKMLERTLGSLNQGKIYAALAKKNNHITDDTGNTFLFTKPGGPTHSEHTVNINLAEGLIGEIVDQTMDETSKVYFNATRERR